MNSTHPDGRRLTLFFLFSVLLAAVVLGIGGRALGIVLRDNFAYFLQSCPCKDVLSWDANLRFIGVMDQYRDFAHGDIWRAMEPFLDAPTWPAFRSALALILYALHPGGPNTVLDVAISYAFFVLLFPSMLYIAVRMSGDLLSGSLVWALASTLLFYTREIPAYSLSSMLETQGMFFMVWTVYFLYRHYEEMEDSLPVEGESERTASSSGGKVGETKPGLFPSRRVAIGLFLSAQGLFHTKYPYGMMLMLGLAAVESLRYPGKYTNLFLFSLKEHYRGVRRVVLFLFLAVPFILILSGRPGGVNLDTKLFKNIVFLIILSVFLDFNYFLFRRRGILASIVPGGAAGIYFLIFFPSVAWLVIHPDRIQSTIGTQLHLQEQTRSFFTSLFRNIFDDPWIISGLTAIFLVALVLGIAFPAKGPLAQSDGEEDPSKEAHRGNPPDHLLKSIRDPLFSVTVLVFMQLLILEMLTGNKQLRHIYHILPSLILLETLWVALSGDRIGLKEGLKRKISPWYRNLFRLASFLVLSWVLFKPANITTAEYRSSRTLCFTGKDRAHYQPAHFVASLVEPGKKYIILNLFHNPGAPLPGSVLSTEMDLLVRSAVGPNGDARNDNRFRWKSWREFQRVLVIEDRCDSSVGEIWLKKRAKETGSTPVLLHATADPQAPICVKEYSIE